MKALAALVRTFFCKVPTAIFLIPGQCPRKSVKTEKGITFIKINIFERNLDREVYFDITKRSISKKLENLKKFPIFTKRMTFLQISQQNSRSRHTLLN